MTPDFRTIAELMKENAKAHKHVFRAFVRICIKLSLYEKELSKGNAYNAETLLFYGGDGGN